MKEIIYNNKKIYIFGDFKNYKKIIVISQGSSENYTSSFMSFIINKLIKANYLVITYDYDFFINKKKVDGELQNEIAELKTVLEYVKDNYSKEDIILMGKSLGGVLSLAYQAENNNLNIEKIYILGLPIVLGYPIRLELLKEKNPTLPDYYEDYKNLLEKIKTAITVLQGTDDDLYDKNSSEKLFSDIRYIKKANHSFKNPETQKDYYKDCFRALNLN